MHYLVSSIFLGLYLLAVVHLVFSHIGISIFAPVPGFPQWMVLTNVTLTILMLGSYFVGSLLLLLRKVSSMWVLFSGLLAQSALLLLRFTSDTGFIILDLLSILSPLVSLGHDFRGLTALLPGIAVCLYAWLSHSGKLSIQAEGE